jgi:hypothetical protein
VFALQKSNKKTSARQQINIKGVKDGILMLPRNRYRMVVDEGELSNLPAYSFYTRIAAMHAQEPMSGVTVLLDAESSAKIAESVRARSRAKYGREVEQAKAKPTRKHIAKPKIEANKAPTDLLQVEESA